MTFAKSEKIIKEKRKKTREFAGDGDHKLGGECLDFCFFFFFFCLFIYFNFCFFNSLKIHFKKILFIFMLNQLIFIG